MADRHAPTIGWVLCAGRNDYVVRYAPAGSTAPLAVADYTYGGLPPAARAAGSTKAELADATATSWISSQPMPNWPADDSDAGSDRPFPYRFVVPSSTKTIATLRVSFADN